MPTKLKTVKKTAAKKSAAPVEVIVAKNRIDDSNNRYMVRKVGNKTSNVAASVILQNAHRESVYNDAFKVERSFGCGVVIVGKPLTKLTKTQQAALVPLKLDVWAEKVFNDKTNAPQLVVFNADGTIQGIL